MTGKRILRVLKFMLFAVLFLTVAGFVNHEAMELAAAEYFRFSRDHILTGNWHFDFEQNSIRRIPCGARPAPVLATSYVGAMGTDDTRGTREIS